MSFALEVADLCHSYQGVEVLHEVSFSLSRNSFLALIGPNGGGKTTLLKILCGLLEPDTGSVLIFGGAPKDQFARIGYVPQEVHKNADFPITALEVVLQGHACESRPLFGYGRSEVACAREALKEVGMERFASSRIGTLSSGQRQRVLIARALCASQTEILFLDEPTASLDPLGQQQIYSLLKALSSRVCVVMVSHDLSVILDYATQVAFVNKTVTFHQAPALDRTSLMQRLGITDGHLCEVDLLAALGRGDG